MMASSGQRNITIRTRGSETLSEYWDDFAIVIAFPDGSDALAQENHYTLEDCLSKFDDVKFFLDGRDTGGKCGK